MAAGLAAGIGNHSIANALSGSPTPTPAPRFYTDVAPMPEEVMYHTLSMQIKSLKEKDAEFRSQGETTGFRESFYKAKLKLAEGQFAAIENAYAEYEARTQPLDARAKQVIDKYRAKYPNGQLKRIEPSGDASKMQPGYEKPPPAPAELGDLQKKKDEAARGMKDSIRNALGQDTFAEFESALRTHSERVLMPVNMKPGVLPKPDTAPRQAPAGEVKK
jgi:hypothetical protein